MAVTKTILKKKQQQAVAKFVSVGGGSATLNIYEIALQNETIDFANTAANVNISHVYFCVDETTTVTRNGNVVLALTGEDNWDFSQETGFVLNDDNTGNITVNFGAGNGTCIVTVTKAGGYAEQNRQILQPWER